MGTIICKCEFGFEHSRGNCRCRSNHVEQRQVKCDVPDEHKNADPEYIPKHRKED